MLQHIFEGKSEEMISKVGKSDIYVYALFLSCLSLMKFGFRWGSCRQLLEPWPSILISQDKDVSVSWKRLSKGKGGRSIMTGKGWKGIKEGSGFKIRVWTMAPLLARFGGS